MTAVPEKLKLKHIARDIEAGELIETFFVWSVVSFICIRVFLILTKFPQIQTVNLHIAHLLFGGFLMVSAIIIYLLYLNKEAKYISAVIGGAGFGAFIDELGKFITKNNDYHYEPAIAIIYIILVILFLISRLVEKYFKFTPEEYAVNALEMVKQALVHDLEQDERVLALRYLKKADQKNILVKILTKTLKEIETIPNKKPNFIHELRNILRRIYLSFIKNKMFKIIVITFFISYSTINLIQALLNFKNMESFFDWGHLVSTLASGIIVLIGIYVLIRLSRRKAYLYFRIAVLIHIFLTQFFLFVEKQFSAIFILGVSIIIWNTLQYLASEEKLLSRKERLNLQRSNI